MFGRYVVTHFLADADLHGHRPAVLTRRPPSWALSTPLGHLISALGSSRLAPGAYHRSPTTAPAARVFAVRGPWAASGPPDGPRLLYLAPRSAVLSCGTFRREPATRLFDWSFAAMPRSRDRFARQIPFGPLPGFPPASPCPGIVHNLSGRTCAALARGSSRTLAPAGRPRWMRLTCGVRALLGPCFKTGPVRPLEVRAGFWRAGFTSVSLRSRGAFLLSLAVLFLYRPILRV